MTASGTEARSPARNAAGIGLLIAISYIGFISLGLPDPVASVAWPSVRDTFSLRQRGFGLIFIALGCGYFVSSFFGGKLTHLIGIGNLLWISSGLVAVAMFGSGLAPVWPVFVISTVVWGLGSGGIDAGLNTYVSKNFSARHMNWLHACYSLGATLGPLIMTVMLVRAGSWRMGYYAVGGLLLLMAILFLVTRNRWTDFSVVDEGPPAEPISMRAALRNPIVWMQIALFFLYVGLEFTVGQWVFTLLTDSRGFSTGLAGGLAGGYYGSIGIGRIVSGGIAHRVPLDGLLRCTMLAALAGTILLSIQGPVPLTIAGLALVGLGLGPVFPCLVARTPSRLGSDHTAHAVGFQISAGMAGTAVLPGVAAFLATAMGLEVVPRFSVLVAALLIATHEILLSPGFAKRLQRKAAQG